MENTYLTITQINNYIKNIFEAEILLQNVCVFGEVSSYNVSNNIAYFTLKDENSALPCMLFHANKFPSPNLGDVILATGSMNYYTKGGRLTFNANYIAPYGRGLLYENYLLLKQKLEGLGYFSLEHKKPMPERVNRIGVVTSSTGAVIHDIMDITKRRNNQVDIVVYPVKVQGVGAENEIAKGIDFFSTYHNVDVVIVARGGGSLEDLQPFNSEIVATATYNCKKPIVSAVGHETDYTIIDFCSDLRAPTPSAAAELLVREKSEDVNRVLVMFEKMNQIVSRKVLEVEQDIKKYFGILELKSEQKINNVYSNLNNKFNKLYMNVNNKVLNIESGIMQQKVYLEKINPIILMEQGYTKLVKEKIVVKNVDELNNGDLVHATLLNGKVSLTVNSVLEE